MTDNSFVRIKNHCNMRIALAWVARFPNRAFNKKFDGFEAVFTC